MTDVLQGDFGDYRIEKLVSEGSLANLYRARHPVHGVVGLKVLHAQLVEDEEILHRFWREMRLPEKLDHPNIARVLDSGVVGDRCYLALEWFPGESFRTLLERHEALPPGEAIRLVLPVLDALDHAHRAGMVHRNLKPEHVLLDPDGVPHLVEFSLAKHFDETVALTRAGEVFGTPWYMSPEQIRSTADVGPPADLYALGIILYELVTGRVPFDGSDAMAVAHKQVKGVVQAPSWHIGGLPRELERVILKALEKSPSDRFTNAASMKKALEYVRAGKKTGIHLVSPVDWPPRHGGRWLLALVLLVLGGLAWARPDWLPASLRGALPGAPTPPALTTTPTPPAPAPADAAVEDLLREYDAASLEVAESFLERRREAITGLDEPGRRRLAEGLRALGEVREARTRLAEALVAFRLSSKVHEAAATHRAVGRILRRTGDPARAAWHESRALQLESGS